MELRRLFDQLVRAVLAAEAMFSKLRLPRTRSPERRELVAVFEHTRAIATALADFLEGLDRELGCDGDGTSPDRSASDEVRGFLREIDPPGGELPVRAPAGLSWRQRSSVIAKLHDFYAFHVDLNNHFYGQRIAEAFAWRQSIGLWQAFVYFGGITASGGLLSRLSFFPGLPERSGGRRADAADREDDRLGGRITAFRREQGFGVITLDDGREVKFDASNCSMVPEEGAAVQLRVGPARWGGGIKALDIEPRASSTPLASAPPPDPVSRSWGDRDLAALRRIAQHAGFLAAADDDALLEYERRAWCEELDDWLKDDRRAGSADDYAIAELLAKAPAPDAAVNERLATLAELDGLGEEARKTARAKIRWQDS